MQKSAKSFTVKFHLHIRLDKFQTKQFAWKLTPNIKIVIALLLGGLRAHKTWELTRVNEGKQMNKIAYVLQIIVNSTVLTKIFSLGNLGLSTTLAFWASFKKF